jgi:hypothetical protein
MLRNKVEKSLHYNTTKTFKTPEYMWTKTGYSTSNPVLEKPLPSLLNQHPYIISFIFILWILAGLQNPYGYGNIHNCLRNQEVKSI